MTDLAHYEGLERLPDVPFPAYTSAELAPAAPKIAARFDQARHGRQHDRLECTRKTTRLPGGQRIARVNDHRLKAVACEEQAHVDAATEGVVWLPHR